MLEGNELRAPNSRTGPTPISTAGPTPPTPQWTSGMAKVNRRFDPAVAPGEKEKTVGETTTRTSAGTVAMVHIVYFLNGKP